MNNICKVILLIIFIFTLTTSLVIAEKDTIEENLYRNQEFRFRIKFPKGWEIKDADGINVVKKAVDGEGSSVVIGAEDVYDKEFGQEDKKVLKRLDFDYDNFNDEEINETLQGYINGILSEYPDAQILDKGITYIDNQKTVYFKSRVEYKVLENQADMIIKYYLTLNNGVLYIINVGAPASVFENKEDVLDRSISTFVFENKLTSSAESTPNIEENELENNYSVDSAIKDYYGVNSNLGLGAFLIMSVLFTYGIGLSIPLIIRFIIVKEPLSKKKSLIIVIISFLAQLILFTGLGSKSKTHGALYIIAFISYLILHKGYKRRYNTQSNVNEETN